MSETSLNTPRKLLAFAAVVEVSTGLVLMIDPATVVTLLLGAEVSGAGTLLGRCFGIALLALGLACWPSRQRAESGPPAFRAMLIYNVLIALYLAYLGTVGHLGGLLLWPGVAPHAVVALLLVWTWRDERRIRSRQWGLEIDQLALMRPPVVKSQKYPVRGFLLFPAFLMLASLAIGCQVPSFRCRGTRKVEGAR